MNIDDLTIGQAKELAKLVSGQPKVSTNLLANAVGKYVIVRSRNEGINAGLLTAADDTGCVLKEARRIWYHKPKDSNTSWYEGVANTGVSDDSKVSCTAIEKYIIEDYSITVCSEVAATSIKGIKSHETIS